MVSTVIMVALVIISPGQQEYSSRWAGVTWGIILAVLIPIILVLVCVGYRLVKKRKLDEENQKQEMESSLRRSNMAHNIPTKNDEEDDDDSIPYKGDSIPYKRDSIPYKRDSETQDSTTSQN